MRSGAYLFGPELEAFEAEFAAFTGAAMQSAWRRAPTRCGWRWSRSAWSRRRGDRARVHRGADRGRGVRDRRVPGVRRRGSRHRGNRSGRPRPRRHRPDRAVIPVHLYGRPAAIPDLGVPVIEDAAQAHGALDPGSARPPCAYSFYPTKNLGGITDGGAVVTDDDDLAATIRLLRAHGLTDDYVHTRVAPTPGCPTSPRPRCGWACGASRPTTRAARIAARYRAAAPALRWHRRTSATSTTCASPACPTVTRFGARPVRHRGALPAGADAAARVLGVRPRAVPGSRSGGPRSACRSRASPR